MVNTSANLPFFEAALRPSAIRLLLPGTLVKCFNIMLQLKTIVKNILFSVLMDSWTQAWRGHDIPLSENLSTFKPLSW